MVGRFDVNDDDDEDAIDAPSYTNHRRALIRQRLPCSTSTSSAAILFFLPSFPFFSVHRHLHFAFTVQALILIRPTSISSSHYKAGRVAASWCTFCSLSFSSSPPIAKCNCVLLTNATNGRSLVWGFFKLSLSISLFLGSNYIGWGPIVARMLLSTIN